MAASRLRSRPFRRLVVDPKRKSGRRRKDGLNNANGVRRGRSRPRTTAGGEVVLPKTDIGDPWFIAIVRGTEGNLVGLQRRGERRAVRACSSCYASEDLSTVPGELENQPGGSTGRSGWARSGVRRSSRARLERLLSIAYQASLSQRKSALATFRLCGASPRTFHRRRNSPRVGTA